MEQTKVYQYVQLLTPAERKQLLHLLEASFFKNSPTATNLYRIIIDPTLLGRRKTGLQDKDQIWAFIAPEEPYDDPKFRKQCNLLLSYVQDFIEILQLRREIQNSRKARYLLPFLRERADRGMVEKETKNLIKKLEAEKEFRLDYFDNWFHVKYEWELFNITRDPQLKAHQLDEAVSQFDLHWVVNRLFFSALLLNLENVRGITVKNEFDEVMLYLIEKSSDLELPMVKTFYTLYKYVKKGNESDLTTLRQLLNQQSFNTPILNHIYRLILNVIIIHSNKKGYQSVEGIFEVYRYCLEHGMLHEYGEKIPHRYYHNLLRLGIRTQNFDWTKDFLETYKKDLEKSYQDISYPYGKAYLLFAQGMNEKAWEEIVQLRNVPVKDVYTELAIRSLWAKIYYFIQEDWTLYDGHLKAYQQYVFRNKTIVSEDIKQGNINWIKFLGRLKKLKHKKAANKLETDINACVLLNNRDWLLKQVQAKKRELT